MGDVNVPAGLRPLLRVPAAQLARAKPRGCDPLSTTCRSVANRCWPTVDQTEQTSAGVHLRHWGGIALVRIGGPCLRDCAPGHDRGANGHTESMRIVPCLPY